MTEIDPSLFSLQITVPHLVYGNCSHIMPDDLIDWIRNTMGLEVGQWVDYSMCGQECWGDGFTDGVNNRTTVYMVSNMREEDALAFKIQFPECKLFVCEQYVH